MPRKVYGFQSVSLRGSDYRATVDVATRLGLKLTDTIAIGAKLLAQQPPAVTDRLIQEHLRGKYGARELAGATR